MDPFPRPYLDRFVRRICLVIPEYRGPRLSYPYGSLVLGLLLSECAGMFAQEAKADWFEDHWYLVKRIWHKAGGTQVEEDGTPSQPTISRLLTTFSEETFSRLVYDDERRQLGNEWEAYLKHCKAGTIARRKKIVPRGPSRVPSTPSMERPAKAAQAKRQVVTKST